MSKEATARSAMKLALEALELNNSEWKYLADSGDSGYWKAEDQGHYQLTNEAITALREALTSVPDWASEALDKKAENARELGLDYEPSSVSKLAREAGIRDCTCNGTLGCLERFAEFVRADAIAAEREACAKVCDDLPAPDYVSPDDVTVWDVATLECGDAIRARGNT